MTNQRDVNSVPVVLSAGLRTDNQKDWNDSRTGGHSRVLGPGGNCGAEAHLRSCPSTGDRGSSGSCEWVEHCLFDGAEVFPFTRSEYCVCSNLSRIRESLRSSRIWPANSRCFITRSISTSRQFVMGWRLASRHAVSSSRGRARTGTHETSYWRTFLSRLVADPQLEYVPVSEGRWDSPDELDIRKGSQPSRSEMPGVKR